MDEIMDVLASAISYASRMGVEFAEIRIERTRFTRIELRDGVINVSSGIDYGAAVRVYANGSIGFAFTTRVSLDSLRRALEQAHALARAAPGKQTKPMLFDPAEDFYEHPVKRSIEDVPIDVKLKDVMELDKLVAEKDFVKSRFIVYNERSEERYYASTEERYLGEKRELVYLYASLFGAEAGVRGSAHITQGTIKGYTLWEKMSQEKAAGELLGRLQRQLRAKTPRAGNFPVVIAPEALGVFVHEAFGHLAEADLVEAGSALQGKKGQQVASSLVTIVDDPAVDDGFGTLRYDDEGVKTAKAVIVEKGIHRQIMTDRIHAALLDAKPTGNARAESFRYPPLVRMRNTLMLPGDHSVEELFEGIEFGYYIVSTAGGQTNIDGSFQVGVEEAYEIVNGEVGEPVRNLSIVGNTLETLLNIDAVAKDFGLFYGRCGKGQLVYVSDGGPHVRVRKMTVGGRE
ncbi:Zn-dependent protease TldD [Pyrodictium delaneyi]|uniref:Zn-dependent protease TldD n=2 Tax=Pyrodictium delaneyi TaxID=1273541 RepID=A0A0P0N170_9CREN|nr:TldD/PmbA family protein [Pyrodictium delaneyi]ALL00199.1 Zn-dependent protease TldD [Pyrodictium delaneyi]